MSKTTAALAALGVVAGLGVAALPLSSYAATTDAKNVNLSAEVQESISLTLTPVEAGADAENTVTPTEGTESDGGLGNININFGTLVADAQPIEATIKANVRTNSARGYSLNLKNADASAGGAVKGSTPALATTAAEGSTAYYINTGTPTAGKSAWGYKLGALDMAGTDSVNLSGYQSVTTAGTDIVVSNAPTKEATETEQAGDNVPITFGITVDSTQEAGVYKGTVTLTATVTPVASNPGE